jgi:hypothetical protein
VVGAAQVAALHATLLSRNEAAQQARDAPRP